jgi:hypothetical protein
MVRTLFLRRFCAVASGIDVTVYRLFFGWIGRLDRDAMDTRNRRCASKPMFRGLGRDLLWRRRDEYLRIERSGGHSLDRFVDVAVVEID